jgi:hypothetical protein
MKFLLVLVLCLPAVAQARTLPRWTVQVERTDTHQVVTYHTVNQRIDIPLMGPFHCTFEPDLDHVATGNGITLENGTWVCWIKHSVLFRATTSACGTPNDDAMDNYTLRHMAEIETGYSYLGFAGRYLSTTCK